jgi:hypothetical protein
MNGYVAFFEGRRHELHADSLFKAKEAAVAFFKPSKSKRHLVTVVLAEVQGRQVTHTAVD